MPPAAIEFQISSTSRTLPSGDSPSHGAPGRRQIDPTGTMATSAARVPRAKQTHDALVKEAAEATLSDNSSVRSRWPPIIGNLFWPKLRTTFNRAAILLYTIRPV
jgi:hypothetical protein